ncbi:MAG: DEAD/DEAH box helicase [Desulfobacterales bacterium]|nr:DEAD/DEAH box helicase [Desulfobacterales bacterium]
MATYKKMPIGKTRRGGLVRQRGRNTHHKRRISKITPSADARLKKVFSKIGVPPEEPFNPDPFQLRALAAISRTDCLVSAPTGSGKTWIAEQAIHHIYRKGGRAWYASPLKALSNSTYLEFSKQFGTEHVGILTGDRKENGDAPIIVGTTEILRNQLYDAMHEGTDLSVDLVVLDEAHFLGDEDRGVVWEEVMIYLPARIHLLLLSATIRNVSQIANWLESIRSKICVVVKEIERPVPFSPLFFHPSGRIMPLLDFNSIDNKVKTYLNDSKTPLLAHTRKPPPFGDIIRVLKKYDLLPAIFFLKSRSDCDAALDACININSAGQSPSKRGELQKRIDELLQCRPYLAEHRQLWYLKNSAVAAHHSGQLPSWKLIIENLMNEGLLDAVFATSTVAAGVNFPARSVVLLNSDRYNGCEFVPLNATEFHQMSGRAGRRGKDNIGFAVVIPGKFMDLRLIANLCTAPPEDVLSQIRVDFSMILNLLLSHTLEEIKRLFEMSFATYLNMVNQEPGLDQSIKETGHNFMTFLPDALCAGPEFALDLIRKRAALTRESYKLKRMLKGLELKLSRLATLAPLSPLRSRVLFIEQELDALICDKCHHFKTCHGKTKGAFKQVLDEFALMWNSANAARMQLLNDFGRHLEFLKEEGFVTQDNRLTADGTWASQLRLDQPLMIAEGLRKGLFPDTDPALLAALIAPFVHDREIVVKLNELSVPKRLRKAYKRSKQFLSPLMERKAARGFEVRLITLWPAATIYAWANGQPWDRVLKIAGMAEGDLAMLVYRTADNLKQIASLRKVYPAIAQSAVDAIAMILREPVIMD